MMPPTREKAPNLSDTADAVAATTMEVIITILSCFSKTCVSCKLVEHTWSDLEKISRIHNAPVCNKLT